jgi:hypothetical protein
LEITTLLQEGCGADLVAAIREVPRALVFISVPWSVPERHSRQVFREAVARIEQEFPQLGISFFRLEADEGTVSQQWLSSVGFLKFASFGAGSLLWLQSGQVISSETCANSLGVDGIVVRSIAAFETTGPA